MSTEADYSKPIVFFDGICGLCNRAVDYIIRIDHSRSLFLASLQGNTSSKVLPQEIVNNTDSIVLFIEGEYLVKSSAVFEILRITRSGWRWLRIFRILPTRFLDWIYDIVAKNRYRIFGKKDTCRIPTEEERSYFLD